MIQLDGTSLTIDRASRVIHEGEPAEPTDAARERVQRCAEFVDRIVREERRVYGVNTGFGKLSTATISLDRLQQLQLNLLHSHACGVGEPLPAEIARAALLFRLNTLLKGHSGVRPVVVDHLARLLNEGAVPIVPRQGSMGSSGDLAPLAHLALLLVGEGQAVYRQGQLDGADLLRALGLEPLELAPKEGLALINGTQVSLAISFAGYRTARRMLDHGLLIAAMALEAAGGHSDPLDARLHTEHEGQRLVAERLRRLTSGSRLLDASADVQDPYSLRCLPQILGACWESLDHVEGVLEREMNAVTDNPLLFPDTDEVRSGGNFHGASLALASETLGVAIAELGSSSERRTSLLLNHSDLPPFLTPEPGLQSGLMIAQYTAASLAAENKVLSHPAAVDSIPTSGGKEDHNSLASVASWKAYQMARNAEWILAVELLTVVQALDHRDRAALSDPARRVHDRVRERIAPYADDRPVHQAVEAARSIIREGVVLHGDD